MVLVALVCLGLQYFTRTGSDQSAGTRVSAMLGGETEQSKQQQIVAADARTIAKERTDVENVAEQFVLRINTYGPHLLNKQLKMPLYISRVHAVATAKLSASFDQGVTYAEQSVAQKGIVRTVTPVATAVSSIDSDSATAMVAATLHQSLPSVAHPLDPSKRIKVADLPLRWVLQMVQVDGVWKVDSFDAVTGDDQGVSTTKNPQKPGKGTPTKPGSSATAAPTRTPTATATGAGR